MSGLTFQATGLAPDLPANFLPVALPVLQNIGPRGAVPLYRLKDGTVQSQPVPLDGLLDYFDKTGPDADGPALFGPVIDNAPEQSGERRAAMSEAETTAAPKAASKDAEPPSGQPASDIGIIDTGIAFWNRDFGAAIRGFKRMAFFSMTTPGSPIPGANVLDPGDMAIYADIAAQEGDRAVHMALGDAFPESVWGGAPGQSVARGQILLSPEALSHGTAMAALAAEYGGAGGDLYGLELPAVAVTDASGDILDGLLAMAIEHLVTLIKQAQGSDARDIVIVVPYAFPGGPHEALTGDDLLSQAIADICGRDRVRIVLPAGNHAEDGAHVALPTPGGQQKPLRLRCMPDDHSSNTVELVFQTEPPDLTITDPTGAAGRLTLGPGVTLMIKEGAIIGAIWCRALSNGWHRCRISLIATASRDGGPLCPAGVWTLEFSQNAHLQAWVVRDDQPLRVPGSPPRRQARFEDQAYPLYGASMLFDAPEDAPDSTLRRQGSLSVLAARNMSDPNVHIATALWAPDAGERSGLAPYSGRSMAGPRDPRLTEVLVDTPRPSGGHLTIANGSARRFRVAGTSAAAAIEAGRRARETEPAVNMVADAGGSAGLQKGGTG